jgi:predicted phosphodiesterase
LNPRNRTIAGSAVLLLVAFLIALPFQVPIARAGPILDYPAQIHLTHQNDPAHTITVTWQTTFSSPGDIVLYDTSSKGGDPSSYGIQAMGSHHTYPGATGHIHDVELGGLSPDTLFYFICGGPGNYSAERSFRTAPVLASDFAFVFGGDSRTDPFHRSEVSKAMSHFGPSFVLHCGDMVEDGTNQGQWDSWFSDLDMNWTSDNGLTIPVIPTLGNHERNSTNYYEQFVLPGNEQWYYYDWGPTLRVIVLNSEALPSQISMDETNWLESVLSQTPNYMWKIVMFHRNVYYSGGHSNATDLQQYWVPIFDRYHVDIVVQGHTHNYQRTKPMNNSALVFSYSVGTMYVTAGGWGAPINSYFPQPYSAYGSDVYHFVLANVYKNGSLHIEAKDVNGITFDSVWLYSPMKYWDFQNGMYVRVRDSNITESPLLTDNNLTLKVSAPTGKTSALEVYCANRGPPLNVSGLLTWNYDDNTKILTCTIIHDSQIVTMFLSWVNASTPGPGTQPEDGLVIILEGLLFASLVAGAILLVRVVYTRNREHSTRSH